MPRSHPTVFQQPMRIQARAGSPAEALYRAAASPGLGAAAPDDDDLRFRGGKLVAQMEFQNIYLGGAAAWPGADIELIDAAIEKAMRHQRLDNVMAQYFGGRRPSCDMRPSILSEGDAKPLRIDEPEVQSRVIALFDARRLRGASLDSCLFNLLLPRGAVLRSGKLSSLKGLGGYHGSVHVERGGRRVTLYYSANVFSELLSGGRENGIAVFDQPWKNVVATLYHEINEFRTDPDVADAIAQREETLLGWMSNSRREIGDQPIARAGELRDLQLAFREVQDGRSRRRIPVQLMYSNAVHGAEGPLARPRPEPR